MFIVKEELLHAVVGHENVRKAVRVEIIDGDPHPLADEGSNTGCGGDVSKTARPLIVKKQIGGSWKLIRTAIGVEWGAAGYTAP